MSRTKKIPTMRPNLQVHRAAAAGEKTKSTTHALLFFFPRKSTDPTLTYEPVLLYALCTQYKRKSPSSRNRSNLHVQLYGLLEKKFNQIRKMWDFFPRI